MNSARITYSQHPEATAEAEFTALANVYRLALDSAKKRGRLPDKNGRADAILRSAEEVGDVELRPDRPSEMT